MSVSFYGKKADESPVMLDYEDPAFLNMASVNARAFLNFLGIEPGVEPSGELPLPEARRAAIRARATFDRHVGAFTREASDTKRPGQARFIQGGIDTEYFTRSLDCFERFLQTIHEKGAISIYWV